jgi:signal transduction histidine kinase/CheY-like chemotaxis protein
MRDTLQPSRPPQDILRRELQRQRSILVREAPVRFVAVGLGYAISAFYLPVLLIVALATVNLLAEIVSDQFLRDIDRFVDSRTRRRIVLAMTFLHVACFVIPPALLWHLEDPYAKALAVGITAGAMMHVATIRAIHLPIGLSGALAFWVIALATNGLYWGLDGRWAGLAASTFCALGSLGYFLSTLIANNRFHRQTLEGWAEAAAANAAKSRFLALVSHELRTPLNAILGMGHAELARQTDPIGRERMELLVESATGLGVLLDDILDLSAVQEGRLPIRVETVNPGAILSASVALFRPQAEAAGLQLDLTLEADLPTAARADGQRLRQCLSNILSNALKFTAQGSVRLTARIAAGGMLHVEVQDTGEGVPDALRDAIFEPFVRGPGMKAGTGLGLTISRSLARRMGGDLVLMPSSRGARFCLTLPLGPADQPPVLPSSGPPVNLHGHLILVVDDIASNRLVAATYLRHFGAQVTEADSGEAALRLMESVHPSAILLDMNMPGMDGAETLRHLRQASHGRADLPVIAMTADATEDHRRACLAAGMDGYVTKPLSPDQLAEALRPHLPIPSDATPPPPPAVAATG